MGGFGQAATGIDRRVRIGVAGVDEGVSHKRNGYKGKFLPKIVPNIKLNAKKYIELF